MSQKKYNDSWLSKNVRPLCLLLFTIAIIVGLFLDISKEKFNYLCELGTYVFGYYFVGRSVFDKQAIKIHYKRKHKNEQMPSS